MLIYDEATDMNKLLKEKQIAVPDNILLPEVLMIATEMISSEKQVAILETEDDEDEMDDSDEDEELKDETFKAYKRFDKHSPSHIVRYCFSKTSKPLFYSDYDQFPSECKTPCENCGAPRIFEFQINSQILAQVKPLLSLDWGVVAFYTCSKCCTSNDSKYMKEVCEIQIAPDEIDSHNMKRLQERKLKEFEKDLKDAGPDMLLDDEIALIKQQIKDEESEDRHIKQANKKRQAKEDTMEEKSGKLFDDELSDDDWA